MNKKDEFKNFVKKNPSLIKHVKDGSMSWQKYYEIYDMYGEDENAWKDYITKEKVYYMIWDTLIKYEMKLNLELMFWKNV